MEWEGLDTDLTKPESRHSIKPSNPMEQGGQIPRSYPTPRADITNPCQCS